MHSSMTQIPADYQVDFSDCQKLERLLEKLSLSREVLRAIEQIASAVQTSNDDEKQFNKLDIQCKPRSSHQMSRHINKVQAYMRKASALQHCAERTSILVGSLCSMKERFCN